MIVYNVQRRWFTMKADAETYRKAEGLPPAKLHKVEVGDREELAGLLNVLCGAGEVDTMPPGGSPLFIAGPNIVPPEVVRVARIVETPDCVPLFLVRDWEKRNRPRAEEDA